jgi:hypothetical protein
MTPSEVYPWTHWKNEKEKRIFLIIDRPMCETDSVILMEVKYYAPGADRTFQRILFIDWVIMLEQKKLVEFIPRIY